MTGQAAADAAARVPACEYLNAAELAALTGKEQPAAQCRALRALGIPQRGI